MCLKGLSLDSLWKKKPWVGEQWCDRVPPEKGRDGSTSPLCCLLLRTITTGRRNHSKGLVVLRYSYSILRPDYIKGDRHK